MLDAGARPAQAAGRRPGRTHSPSSLPLSRVPPPRAWSSLSSRAWGSGPPGDQQSGLCQTEWGGGRSIRVDGQETRGPSLRVPRTVQVSSCPRGSLWTAPVCLERVSLQTLSQVVAPSRCPGAVQHTLGPFSGGGCPRDAPGVPLPGWAGLCWKPLLVDLTGRPPARALASSCGVRRTHWPPWAQHLPPGCGHRSPAGLGAHWAAVCGKRAGPERGHGQEGQVTLDRAGGERTSCGGRSSDVHSVLLFMEGL